jgi:hypothetical protein
MTRRTLTLACSLLLPASLVAAENRSGFTPACAEQDLKTVALLETQAEAELASATLAELGLAQLAARLACASGRESEALALYDGILRADAVLASRK